MTDVWGFVLQTLYVSLVGGLLLLVKAILRDKLTPRWQYGVWSVLALRILVPVDVSWKYVLLPLPLWVETARILAEQAVPALWFTWLYWLYLAGVAVFLLRYLVSYIRLRLLLKRGEAAPEGLTAQVKRVAEQYGLKPCQAVVLSGLSSPMVCGVFRPVLAVPEGAELDDHVILHELLHVKYHDALQNVFWSICRALHWCNPLVHWFMDQNGNDMESLCDQRVLERLEGEERRNYGLSLLAMANDRYPRAPGTTSISNGGKNITRRIEAIVRFKKYPKGMALASVCVTVMLLCAALFPTSVQGLEGAEEGSGPWVQARAEASLNLVQCTTVAGAIDTYAEGLIEGNQEYLSLASPTAKGFNRRVQIYDYSYEIEERYFDTGQSTTVSLDLHGESFAIHNLRTLPDGNMAAELIILLGDITDDPILAEIESGEGYPPPTGVVQLPIQIWEEEGWKVDETGEGILYVADLAKSNATGIWLDTLPYAPHKRYTAAGETGTVEKEALTEHYIGSQKNGLFGLQTPHSKVPNPNAEFSYVQEVSLVTYTFDGTSEEKSELSTVLLQYSQMKKTDRKPYFSDHFVFGEGSWGSEFGRHHGQYTSELVSEDWDGIVKLREHATYEYNEYPNHGGAVQIRWDGEVMDEMILEEVTSDG